MNLRQATQADAEAIALLHAASWRRTYRGMMPDDFLDGDVVSNRLQVWHERLGQARPGQYVLLAEVDGQLAGFICAYAGEDPRWGSYIDNLHVAFDYQRRDIGAALMANAARWLDHAAPQSGVYLWVMQANANARRFYERLGAGYADTVDKSDPSGGSAPNCRIVWASPALLAGQCAG